MNFHNFSVCAMLMKIYRVSWYPKVAKKNIVSVV
jgi:hypothetical protein